MITRNSSPILSFCINFHVSRILKSLKILVWSWNIWLTVSTLDLLCFFIHVLFIIGKIKWIGGLKANKTKLNFLNCILLIKMKDNINR